MQDLTHEDIASLLSDNMEPENELQVLIVARVREYRAKHDEISKLIREARDQVSSLTIELIKCESRAREALELLKESMGNADTAEDEGVD